MTSKVTAIVLSGGKGKRMGTTTSKQYLLLDGRPILYYSLKAFDDSNVDEIVLVVGSDDIEYVRQEIVEKYSISKVKVIVEGGKERYNSVYNGLCAVKGTTEENTKGYVLVHDGARPFITVDIINRTIDEVKENKACIVGVPAKDTIKLVDNAGNVADTPDRSKVWQVQTPQAFEYNLIFDSYKRVIDEGKDDVTDDSMVVEYASDAHIKMIMGSYNNIKITTPEDLLIGLEILKSL